MADYKDKMADILNNIWQNNVKLFTLACVTVINWVKSRDKREKTREI